MGQKKRKRQADGQEGGEEKSHLTNHTASLRRARAIGSLCGPSEHMQCLSDAHIAEVRWVETVRSSTVAGRKKKDLCGMLPKS